MEISRTTEIYLLPTFSGITVCGTCNSNISTTGLLVEWWTFLPSNRYLMSTNTTPTYKYCRVLLDRVATGKKNTTKQHFRQLHCTLCTHMASDCDSSVPSSSDTTTPHGQTAIVPNTMSTVHHVFTFQAEILLSLPICSPASHAALVFDCFLLLSMHFSALLGWDDCAISLDTVCQFYQVNVPKS